jgi:hypothetical protein
MTTTPHLALRGRAGVIGRKRDVARRFIGM